MTDKDRKLIDKINKYRGNNLPGERAADYGCLVTITSNIDPGIRLIQNLKIDYSTGFCNLRTTHTVELAYIFDSKIAKALCTLLPCLGVAKEVNIYPVKK